MKVILLQDVKGQGKRGQLVDVSDGYARNFLLPRKLAQEATADNVNTMKMNDKALQEKRQKEREQALELSKVLKEMTLVVTAKGGGSVKLTWKGDNKCTFTMPGSQVSIEATFVKDDG